MTNPLFRIEFDTTQVKALADHFAKADKTFSKEAQQSVSILGAKWVTLARAEAPHRTGTFENSISVVPYTEGNSIGFKGISAGPLSNWIKFGTKAHRIPLDKRPPGKPLYFFWATGPDGPKYYTFYSVKHPGTKPNPYHLRAWEHWKREAITESKRLGLRFITTLAGGEE